MFVAGFASAAEEPPRPNIVFIMADDLGYGDLGCYGQQHIKTPNIDRLAAEGIRFTQAYAGGPVCTPSRSVLMTGLHNGHTVARDNVPHYVTYLQDDDTTLAEVLTNAGYRCGGVGKWSLGDAGSVGRATNQGFDTWFGYLNQDHAHYYYPEYLDDNEARLELPGNSKSHHTYSHTELTERALQFIDESSERETPFFLYAAYTLPHFSSLHEDADGLTVPSTEPYSDHNWEPKAKKYAAMIHMLDQDVGRIVNQIDDCGIRDNTLIIFTSDNGGHKNVAKRFDTNGPLRGYKRDLTEGGIRVPLIAHWPGQIPADQTSDEVIAFQDMMPTFAELAGGTPPANHDGISIIDALKGQRLKTPHDYLYWDFGHCRTRYHQAVRMNQWKGIRSDVRLGVAGPIQLYDLQNDIGEEHDVASEHPEIVQQIDRIMRSAVTPSTQYPIGKVYRGHAIWQPKTGP
ncbi:N-acetylgalactosamine 6-sulfate sulfatase (GALNS) [Rhodopirellula maiorica SM1]|uniref:N-acetylgalactosamine 6-sulfate sulfatase (GALNS) n=1 Tax=Rhodopirellula maiorica SM1 TaxID=1265738 RepID=M5RXQ4_9BACT|nr:N-acetylgalactosamine 6-sulfate sulfatase (GALNS) [Rhodopirellula maiorica SM1]